MDSAAEVCETTRGGKHQENETWWGEVVQQKIKEKGEAFKKRQKGEDLKEVYKKKEKEVKKVVAKKKHGPNGMQTWTRKMIYKVAKQRARTRQDVGEWSSANR